LIRFQLIVNNNSRAIIQSTFRSISVSGFDTRKKLSKDYYVKLRAIPNDIRLNERESTTHVCNNQQNKNIMREIFISRVLVL
jgi:hypothetical protein